MWPRFCQCVGEGIDTKHIKYALENLPKNKEMFALAKKVKGKYQLGIITGNPVEKCVLIRKKFDLDRLFEIFVSSGEVGVFKDNPKIFEVALERAGVKSEESVFIEDKEKNLTVAKKLGFKTILFNGDIKKLQQDLQDIGVEI